MFRTLPIRFPEQRYLRRQMQALLFHALDLAEYWTNHNLNGFRMGPFLKGYNYP
jgi:hypothetical protein